MKKVGALWRSLTRAEQDVYRKKSTEEFATQRQELREKGIHFRTSVAAVATEPAEPQTAPPAQACQQFGAYQVVRALGESAYGSVQEAIGPDGQRAALKVFKSTNDTDDINHEEKILRDLQSLAPAVQLLFPRLLEKAMKPMPFLATEYAGQTLAQALTEGGALTAENLWAAAAQLRKGLESMHHIGYAHMDLKPKNILYRDHQIKICDFGMTECFKGPVVPRFLNNSTPLYRAPEFWQASETGRQSSDVAACQWLKVRRQ